MSQPTQVQIPRGTRTPRMLEYERQAEERIREAEKIANERDMMMAAEAKMRKEQDRIAQEEYEMQQYYEAEVLKHAEDMRQHREEVKRHQARVREHERRVADHEASAEAFARVIAMPAQERGARQLSFFELGKTATKNGSISSMSNAGSGRGSPT